jgi:hypothetical protein
MNGRKIKARYREWFGSLNGDVAFTGTFRQAIGSSQGYYETIDIEKARITINQFIERSSRAIFGRKAVRGGVKLRFAGSLEGDAPGPSSCGTRLHTHLTLSNLPLGFDVSAVRRILLDHWTKTKWGYAQIDVQKLQSEDDHIKWLDYALKGFKPSQSERFITNISSS